MPCLRLSLSLAPGWPERRARTSSRSHSRTRPSSFLSLWRSRAGSLANVEGADARIQEVSTKGRGAAAVRPAPDVVTSARDAVTHPVADLALDAATQTPR